jgi:hypothetical protein
MNTADRSIGRIDYAIRRRFVFYNLISNKNLITDEKSNKLYEAVSALFNDAYLSHDFIAADVMIGHSYFLSNGRNLEQRLEFEIKPLLREYIKDGILIGDDIEKKVESLNV